MMAGKEVLTRFCKGFRGFGFRIFDLGVEV